LNKIRMSHIALVFLALFLGGAVCGSASAQNANPQTNYASQMLAANPSVYLTFNNSAIPLRENQTGVTFNASSAGTITANQTGFDNTQQNNTAASFTYNAYAYAPNNTLGSFEWYQPFSVVFQIDRFNWVRSGTKVLVTKGATNGSYYQLTAVMGTATTANFCIQLVAKGALTAPNQVNETTCTPLATDMPNGLNYTIIAGSDGTGQPNTTGLWITVNGLGNGAASMQSRYYNAGGTFALGGISPTIGGSGTGYAAATPFNGVGGGSNCFVFGLMNASGGVPASTTLSYKNNFGCTSAPTIAFAPYNVTLGGSGTGYAASTAFTSTGGGTGCAIAGTMTSSGGVPASLTITQDTNACTSAPTIVLTTPTGTGATLTASATTGTGATLTAAMENASLLSASQPLYLLGSYSGTAASGSSTVSTDAPIIVDTFAMFPALLTQTQIHSIFYQTKFYQSFLKALPAVPYTLIYDNDGTADPDDVWALTMTIAAERIGYIRLAAVSTTTNDGTGAALYRNMLDQAGLAHIPVCVPSSFSISTTTSSSASSPIYNAATSQTISTYPQCKTVYRKVFAANPTTPVFIMLAGSFRSLADFMQSAADSVSSLTGAQLMAQNATNGGAIYLQGGSTGPPHTYTSAGDNSFIDWTAGQYVLANNGTTPVYFFGGSPQVTGPGPLYTRNAKDPVYLYALNYGGDVRNGYDSLPTLNFISSKFSMPVTITISAGGTGYATTQAFTSTGGGPNCSVSGTITSVSGVLTTVNYPNTLYSTYFGIGSGCTSAPTIVLTAPTGTGASLTTATTVVCGTQTLTSASAGTITTTCGNQYFVNPSSFTDSAETPIMTWMANSMNDPPPNGAPRVQ
jgi:hypothetical protein